MRLERFEHEPVEGAPGVAMATLVAWTSVGRVRVDVASMAPGASLPRHAAGSDQSFCVLAGTGRVAGADDVAVQITAGWAAVWERGELHTSWADTPMTVLIVQRTPPLD
jgi:quercetin dioxygenase-like cupin family protein